MENLRQPLLWLLIFALAVSIAASLEEAQQREADRVTNLPGQPRVQFEHYAGYVQLQPQNEKAMFYWFFEAQDGPSLKPLVLWLNGGQSVSKLTTHTSLHSTFQFEVNILKALVYRYNEFITLPLF